MSENLNIRSTLTAVNEASPVIRSVLADLKRLERAGKSFNASFANLGRAGITSLDGFNRAAKSASAHMQGVASTARSASRSYSESWTRATEHRLNENRRLYSQLDRMESTYRQQIERTAAAERRAVRGGGIGRARIPAPQIRSLIYGGIAVSGGVGAVLAQRMKVDAAETKAKQFGGLTPNEIVDLRKSFANRAGIMFGVGVTKAIETAVEGLKAGVDSTNAGAFGELALQAQTGLDIDSGATAKLLGRITTLKGAFNKSYLGSVLNAVAVANNSTAADGNEIVEALRRSISATVATKMSMQDLAAFDASAISVGIQSYKAGTFMGFITTELANARNARGQRGKDLNRASLMLGFGGRSDLSGQMIAKPTETLLTIFERMMQMPEELRAKVANLVGMREWSGELLQLAAARNLIAKTITEIANKPGFLQSASLLKIKSMAGRWASIKAAFGLIAEKIGAGLSDAFDSISNAAIDLATNFNFDTIKDHFAALVDGLREGFGIKDIGSAIKSFAASFDAGTVEKWKLAGRGFAEGLVEVVNTVKGAFTGLASFFGKGDAESMGKFTARLLGLTVALSLVAPVVNILGSISLFLLTIGAVASGAATGITALFFALTMGAKFALSWVADKIFGAFRAIVDPIVGMIKSIVTKTWDWIRGLFGFGGSSSGHGASGSWDSGSSSPGGTVRRSEPSGGASGLWSPTSFRAVDSFNSGVASGSGGIQRAFYSGASSGGGRGSMAPPSLLSSTPGQALPDFGAGSSNIIKRGVPSFTGGGGSAADNVGAGLSGNSFLAARRARFAEEIKNDPTLRLHLAAMQMTEGTSKGGTVESLMNRADMQGTSLRQMLGFSADGVRSVGRNGRFNSFYGPIRRGEIYGAISKIQANPKLFARYDSFTKNAIAGSHVIGGYTDQGLPTDPNGSIRTGIPGYRISPKDGNEFTDWVGPGSRFGRGRAGAKAYRKLIEQGIAGSISAVPTAAGAIKNVPSITSRNGDASLGGGSRGQVAIHINGGSHDPEALALLVQRRVDESMNWRTHESESEYT